MLKKLKEQNGFTLVEMAIVLVIIGLILGAVLKGQELINNAKLKRAYNMQREVTAAFYTYYDKYGKYPGDDNTATTRWAGVTNGDNSGLIDPNPLSLTCAAGDTTETCQAWMHMRSANLLTGSATSAINPNHPYGGTVGLGTATVQGLTTQWIAFQNVPYDVCQLLDLSFDDGVYNTGTIRGSGNYNTATSGTFTIYFRL